MSKAIFWTVIPASAILLAGCGIQHTAKHPAPKPIHRTTRPKPTPKERPKPRPKPKTESLQAPKVGTTTITKKTVGNTTTITKTTVVGSTTTSILQPTTSHALPTHGYTVGETFPSTGSSALSAFDALWTTRHHTPPPLPVPIQTVAVPWLSGTQWAVIPQAMADPSQGGPILWFGESTKPNQWTWIPDDLAGQIPHILPLPMRDTLQWAVDLAFDMPGPHGLLGPAPWSAVTGTVKMPVGWTLQAIPTGGFWPGSPGGLTIKAWDPSTQYSPLYFAPVGNWTRTNAATGKAALLEIMHSAVSLRQVLAPPPPAS